MYSDPSSLVTADYAVNTLSWDNDVSVGHSGSAIWTSIGTDPAVIAVVTNGNVGSKAFGPRMRSPMWDDLCDWIADPASASSFGSHPLCP